MPQMTTLEPVGDWLYLAPWRTRAVSFLSVRDSLQAFNLTDKRDMLDDVESGQVLVLWTGSHYTSVRYIAEDEREEVRNFIA